MEKLLSLKVKVLASAFQFLMFKKPLPPKVNSFLSLLVYDQLGLAMQRQSRC
jgi:hypothetical protein